MISGVIIVKYFLQKNREKEFMKFNWYIVSLINFNIYLLTNILKCLILNNTSMFEISELDLLKY
jgi:hypothetical protein